MSQVHILPPEIVSKIAAGEVIERPASVIKELVENALDAGTQSIEVRLQQAGKALIHVRDNGSGIAAEDIPKIFHRHSTSKIEKLTDLYGIRSLGFRGEALYSISSIADVVLRSRTRDQDTGWEIHMRDGKQLDLRPAALPVGTDIEVKELFFNTPARRKFLKSNTTEMNQILNTFIPYALLSPGLRFLLAHEDKAILDLPPAPSPAVRIADALNLEEGHLLEARRDIPEEGIAIHMILGDINIVRSRRDMQFIFVNNRPVQNKSIGFHMNNVYRLILPQGHYPFFALFIEVPADDLDVNVHPTKREVKIKDEQYLCSILRQLCESTLMTGGQAKQVGEAPGGMGEKTGVGQALAGTSFPGASYDEASPADMLDAIPAGFAGQPATEQYAFPETGYVSFEEETLLKQKRSSLQARLAQARYAGSFRNKYIFFETESSLLVVDQHAAQERITFERLILQMEKGQVEIQHLLSPHLVKLSPQDILVWEQAKKRLEEAGFTSTLFDAETVAVHTYPVLLKDPVKAVHDILSGENVARCDHETLARRACRSSVMAGDPMNQQKAEFQRQQLLACRDPFTCPHGRPTLIELTEDYLDKQFLRT